MKARFVDYQEKPGHRFYHGETYSKFLKPQQYKQNQHIWIPLEVIEEIHFPWKCLWKLVPSECYLLSLNGFIVRMIFLNNNNKLKNPKFVFALGFTVDKWMSDIKTTYVLLVLLLLWVGTFRCPGLIHLCRPIHRPIGTLEMQCKYEASGSLKQTFLPLTWCTFYKEHNYSHNIRTSKVVHLAGVTLWPRNLPEALIEGQIVPDGVLDTKGKKSVLKQPEMQIILNMLLL